ncbi:MFS transporter [Arsukibacterium sp. MJ3]|uniref:MFS transporter n=1 Tax=Arsukibacterium sp. MJ3 TaxID=1632859 RepID=UPI00069ADCC9|nr:MFS transporter [Arsukibacterium sp. MJ3]
MKTIFRSTWPLFLGVAIVGMTTGLQNTLLSLRAELEGFASASIGVMLAGYFIGFLLGSLRAPKMIMRVGHIRAFAALASLASISILLHAIWINTYAWFFLRLLSGFCFSAIFVIAESWINDKADNQNRGTLLSIYVSMLFGGIGLGQFLITVGDPRDFIQFTLVSVLISAAVIPLLITKTPAPTFQQAEKMPARQLLKIAPLGVLGCFILQFGYASMFGFGPVYFSRLGLSLLQIASLMAIFIFGCLCMQFQLGKLSDKFDRKLIMTVCGVSASMVAIWLAQLTAASGWQLYLAFYIFGALFLPLYSMAIAHTNDHLAKRQMVAASSVLIRANGLGAIGGLLLSGILLDQFGSLVFFYFISLLPAIVALMAFYHYCFRRQTSQRPHSNTVSPTQVTQTMINNSLNDD